LPDAPVDFPIRLNEKVIDGQMMFTINDAVHPNIPLISVRNGDIRVLDVTNESEMDHPFHLHGFFFQILAKNGAALPAEALANKDTLIIPAKASYKLVARFDEPGSWMYHCHILEHGEHGMMGELRVE
jgi:FtsP/CotA-like multicopper oxidase with cupredoxin domain